MSLGKNYSINFPELLLARNLNQLMRTFLWISLRQIFLKRKNYSQPFVWFRYKDNVFFIWTHGKEELKNFMKELNRFRDHIKFTFDRV